MSSPKFCVFVGHSFLFVLHPMYSIDKQIQLLFVQLIHLSVQTESNMFLFFHYLVSIYCFIVLLHLLRVSIEQNILPTLTNFIISFHCLIQNSQIIRSTFFRFYRDGIRLCLHLWCHLHQSLRISRSKHRQGTVESPFYFNSSSS